MWWFLVAAGGVAIGYMLRAVESKAQRIRVEPYPQRINEPHSNVVPFWLDDDTDGLTID